MSQRRGTRRVTDAKVAWTRPALMEPAADTNAIAATGTLNSAMTSRNRGGRMTAWAWLTAWATARSQRVRRGRTASDEAAIREASAATAGGYGPVGGAGASLPWWTAGYTVGSRRRRTLSTSSARWRLAENATSGERTRQAPRRPRSNERVSRVRESPRGS